MSTRKLREVRFPPSESLYPLIRFNDGRFEIGGGPGSGFRNSRWEPMDGSWNLSPETRKIMADLVAEPYEKEKVGRPRVVTDTRNGREFRIVNGVVETRYEGAFDVDGEKDRWVRLPIRFTFEQNFNQVNDYGHGLGLDVERIKLLAELAANPTELVDAE
jgi:hypothetical protein